MIILRNKIFSNKKKDSDEKDEKESENKKNSTGKNLAIYATGTGIVLGSDKISDRIIKRNNKKVVQQNNVTSSDAHEINEKLKTKARSMGIDVVNDPEFKNSAYLGTPLARKIAKVLPPEMKREAERQAGLGEKSRGKYGTDSIAMGLGDGNPAVLAHEMGHAAMSQKGRSHDILGKAAHSPIGQLAGIPSEIGRGRGGVLYLGAGVRHGLKAAKKEEEGDKKGARKELRKGLIRSSLLAAPKLIAEGAASRKGLKYLKEAGASKETMKNARKTLGHAFGTYAGGAMKPILLDTGGTAMGYALGKQISKARKKEKESESKKSKKDNKKD